MAHNTLVEMYILDHNTIVEMNTSFCSLLLTLISKLWTVRKLSCLIMQRMGRLS
eukprot:jgi/Bigna1/65820/fgenesh1_kg.131_\